MQPAQPLQSNSSTRGTALFLIAVNLLPLAGVLFWNWSLFQVVALYWLENLIIGAINLLKMLVSSPDPAAFTPGNPSHLPHQLTTPGGRIANNASKVFLIPFFTVHYGMFCLAHGVFIGALLGKDSPVPSGGLFSHLPSLLSRALADGGLIAAAGLAVSHLVSFVHHFILRGEYRRTAAPMLMAAPYGRIVVLHLAIIFGAWLILALGSPLALLGLLVAGKTVLDLKIHIRSHRRLSGAGTGEP